jgi:hypothetical protein
MTLFRDAADEPLDDMAVERDEELLDALVAALADDAVSWDLEDPGLRALAALRAEIDAELPIELPAPRTRTLPVVDLSERRRLSRFGRSAVAGGVALVVLSASGVAAAGIATDRGPLAPIHHLLTGESKSDKAATQVERFLALAQADLDAGRLDAARAALAKAAAEIDDVDEAERNDLRARLTALQERLSTLLAAKPGRGHGPGVGGNAGESGQSHGQDTAGAHRNGSGADNSGRDDDAGSGQGGGNDDQGEQGGGRDSGNSQGDDSGKASGGDENGDDNADQGSDDSGSESRTSGGVGKDLDSQDDNEQGGSNASEG